MRIEITQSFGLRLVAGDIMEPSWMEGLVENGMARLLDDGEGTEGGMPSPVEKLVELIDQNDENPEVRSVVTAAADLWRPEEPPEDTLRGLLLEHPDNPEVLAVMKQAIEKAEAPPAGRKKKQTTGRKKPVQTTGE